MTSIRKELIVVVFVLLFSVVVFAIAYDYVRRDVNSNVPPVTSDVVVDTPDLETLPPKVEVSMPASISCDFPDNAASGFFSITIRERDDLILDRQKEVLALIESFGGMVKSTSQYNETDSRTGYGLTANIAGLVPSSSFESFVDAIRQNDIAYRPLGAVSFTEGESTYIETVEDMRRNCSYSLNTLLNLEEQEAITLRRLESTDTLSADDFVTLTTLLTSIRSQAEAERNSINSRWEKVNALDVQIYIKRIPG